MAIVAREREEKAMTATMMEACVTGSIFISKANFIRGASGEGWNGRKGLKERVCKSACVRGRNHGQKRRPKLGDGFSMVHRCGQNPSGDEVSISLDYALRTTDRLTK